jgi:hypothetical protein
LVPLHGSQHASSLKARQRVAPVNGDGALQAQRSTSVPQSGSEKKQV